VERVENKTCIARLENLKVILAVETVTASQTQWIAAIYTPFMYKANLEPKPASTAIYKRAHVVAVRAADTNRKPAPATYIRGLCVASIQG